MKNSLASNGVNKKNVIDLYETYVIPTYAKTPLVLARGKGTKVWDEKGKEYLDFFPGWAVSGIGHCHPRVVKAVQKQVAKLIHVSNNNYHGFVPCRIQHCLRAGKGH